MHHLADVHQMTFPTPKVIHKETLHILLGKIGYFTVILNTISNILYDFKPSHIEISQRSKGPQSPVKCLLPLTCWFVLVSFSRESLLWTLGYGDNHGSSTQPSQLEVKIAGRFY